MYNSMISAHIFFKQVFLKLTLDKKHHSTIDWKGIDRRSCCASVVSGIFHTKMSSLPSIQLLTA